jgi:hypothetical protein
VGLSLGRAEGPLTSPAHVAIETVQYEVVDPPVSRLGTPEREVVAPAFQVPIQLRNQARPFQRLGSRRPCMHAMTITVSS